MSTSRRQQAKRRSNLIRLIAVVVIGLTGTFTLLKSFAATPINPKLACSASGYDVVFVIDHSSSIDANGQNGSVAVRQAFQDIATKLYSIHSEIGVVLFNDSVSNSTGITGDSATLATTLTKDTASLGGTNWEAAFKKTNTLFKSDPRPSIPNLVIFASDGAPDLEDSDVPPNETALDAAIPYANSLKAANTRILAVFMKNKFVTPGSTEDKEDMQAMQAITGSAVNTGSATDIMTTDYATLQTDLDNQIIKMCPQLAGGPGNNGNGNGNNGNGNGKGAQNGGSPVGASANTVGNTNKQALTTSAQGATTKPPQQTPSPFYDGKQYAAGSETDTASGGSAAKVRSQRVWWLFISVLVVGGAVAGYFLLWKRRGRKGHK